MDRPYSDEHTYELDVINGSMARPPRFEGVIVKNTCEKHMAGPLYRIEQRRHSTSEHYVFLPIISLSKLAFLKYSAFGLHSLTSLT